MHQTTAAPEHGDEIKAGPQAAPLARPMFFLALVAIVALSLVPGESRPHTGFPGPAEHFAAYAGAGFLLALSYAARRERIAGLLALVAASGVLELLQNLSPGRHPSAFDALASSSGAALGTAVSAALFAPVATRLLAQQARLRK